MCAVQVAYSVVQAKWDVSISGGNGARDQPTAYGGVPGLCGDPFEGRAPSNFVNMPCTAQETYQEGGIMSMQIDVAANHGGFWEVSICDSENISQECFDRNKLKTCVYESYNAGNCENIGVKYNVCVAH